MCVILLCMCHLLSLTLTRMTHPAIHYFSNYHCSTYLNCTTCNISHDKKKKNFFFLLSLKYVAMIAVSQMHSNPSDRRTEDINNSLRKSLRKTLVQEVTGMKGEMNDRSGLPTTSQSLCNKQCSYQSKTFFLPCSLRFVSSM